MQFRTWTIVRYGEFKGFKGSSRVVQGQKTQFQGWTIGEVGEFKGKERSSKASRAGRPTLVPGGQAALSFLSMACRMVAGCRPAETGWHREIP
jgi:hypothetical protein